MKDHDRVRTNKLQREAEGYLELGLAAAALRTLAHLSPQGRKAATSLYLEGEALRALERYADAIAPLRAAARAEPENIHIWLALGWCYKRTGRLDQAISAMRRALLADPAEALLHYNLACYLSLAHKKDGAIRHLSQAVAMNPDYCRAAEQESDFDPIRSDPDFQAVTGMAV